VSLAFAVGRFLEHCRISKRLSSHTLRAYETDLTEFASFVGNDTALDTIDRNVLRRFAGHLFDKRGLKETTVKRRMAALKVMFRWLELDEAVELSPFHRLDLTIRLPRRLPRSLTVEEMRRLLRTAEREAKGGGPLERMLHFVVVCLFSTGLRISELTAAKRSDVDIHEGSILVHGKGSRERKVYLPGREALEALARFTRTRDGMAGAANEQLLLTPDGQAIKPQLLRHRLAGLAKRAGIERRVTPHMLRHTAATQLIEAGVDIRFVQKLLGHASIATTQIYTQVSDSSLKSTLERANTLRRMGG
jgi:integrase/recombinase XerD